jgi:hypothetical protein
MGPHKKSEWYFEKKDIGLLPTSMLLVRVMIGKVERMDRFYEVIGTVSINLGENGWNCVSWVKEAVERLNYNDHTLGSNVTVWEKVRDGAMWYVQKKKAGHRFKGRETLT